MKKHERKSHPINRNVVKLKRILTGKKARDPHKLYPEQYFRQYWHCEQDVKCINALSRLRRLTKKEAVHQLTIWGFQVFLLQIANQRDNEGTERIRYYMEFRRMCREQGWDVHKIFPRPEIQKKEPE